MSTMDLSESLFRFYLVNLSKKEKLLLETIFFIYLQQELILLYRAEENMEVPMVSSPVVRGLVNDLLLNNDYTVQGLAHYTGYPEDVIYDLASGLNLNPTLALSTKIIELHAIARRDLYSDLIKRIIVNLNQSIESK